MKVLPTKAIVIAIILAWFPSAAVAGIAGAHSVPPSFAHQWRWLDRDWAGALVPGPYVSYAF